MVVPVLIAGAAMMADPGMSRTLSQPFAVRVVIAFAVVGSLGFFLGFAFPAGFARFGDGNKAWFWAMNGTASVCSLALAMAFGLSNVMLAATAAYAIAWILLRGNPVLAKASSDPCHG
jgi:predicted membrane chloride channel (bestrophin family)